MIVLSQIHLFLTVKNTYSLSKNTWHHQIRCYQKYHSFQNLHLWIFRIFLYIIFPQAIKNTFPSIGNQLIVNIKDSSMLNVISVTELYFQTTSVAGSNMKYIECFLIAAIIYLFLTTISTFILNYIEKRLNSEKQSKDFCS